MREIEIVDDKDIVQARSMGCIIEDKGLWIYSKNLKTTILFIIFVLYTLLMYILLR